METSKLVKTATAAREDIMQATSMDRAYIDEHDVVQRYIRRTLSESELSCFEIYMLANASIVEEIEQQRMLNQIFREELPKATRALANSQNMVHRLRHALPLAACLVLAVYVGVNISGRQALDTAAVATLDTVVLQDLRGTTEAFTVSVPASVDRSASVELPLKIDVGPQLEPVVTYSVAVHSSDGKVMLSQLENQRASGDGWLQLTVALPAATPASYQVEVVEFPRGDSRSYSLSLQ